jgi:hypothetical protein
MRLLLLGRRKTRDVLTGLAQSGERGAVITIGSSKLRDLAQHVKYAGRDFVGLVLVGLSIEGMHIRDQSSADSRRQIQRLAFDHLSQTILVIRLCRYSGSVA